MKIVRRVLIWIGGFLILYMSICLVIYFMQERMVFNPKKLASDYKFQFENEFEELFIAAPDGIKLSGALFKADTSKGLIFFLHGSGGNIERYRSSVPKYLSLNYDLFLLDFRGFGKSDGNIKSEKQYFDDVSNAYDYMKSRYNEENIIIIGFSQGNVSAAMLASKNKPRLLILEGSRYSTLAQAKKDYPFLPISIILKYKFETYKYIQDTKVPISIFHGSDDDAVNPNDALKLKQHLKPGDHLTILDGEGHNDFATNDQYLNELRILLK
jgi:alpha-beta hydrolase superfamily lysophospholipase